MNLNMKLYEQLLNEELPPKYKEQDPYRVIKDLIHLQHPLFTKYQSLVIPKTATSPRYTATPKQSLLSPRKQYEVDIFTQYITNLPMEIEYIIDFGSGKSYISRELAKLGYKVVCVELSSTRTKTAKRLDLLHQNLNNIDSQILYINSLNANITKIQRFVNATKKNNNSVPKALLIGLDSCGSTLPNLIIDSFINTIEGLELIGCAFVSCCFHKVAKLLTYEGEFENRAISQDLRFLSSDEVIDHYLKTTEDEQLKIAEFSQWCFDKGKGLFSEFVILKDRKAYLSSKGFEKVEIEVIFDFKISSRNVLVACYR